MAVTTSASAIVINVATDLKRSWWAWIGVVALTVITAFVSHKLRPVTDLTPQKSEDSASRVVNIIDGKVSGNAVQANRIEGDINF